MTNLYEERINGRLIMWGTGFPSAEVGWCVEELRAGKMVRVVAGLKSFEAAVKAGRDHYDEMRNHG